MATKQKYRIDSSQTLATMKRKSRLCFISILLLSRVESFLYVTAPSSFRLKPNFILKASGTASEDEQQSSGAPSFSSSLEEFDPEKKLGLERKVINVGDPQIKIENRDRSVTDILAELAAIQQMGPQKYCILGTRHCSFLHQQIVELL